MTVVQPKGVNFNKKQTEYQLFPEEYFTAADCYVYFNDVWLDELTGLSFSLHETVNPIFGYASNTWDYVGRGKRLVQGQFSIAFTEAGYLWTVLDHIGQKNADGKNAIGMLLNDDLQRIESRTHGGVLESIEELLNRVQLDTNAKAPDKIVKKKRTLHFDWPVPMKIHDTDSMDKYKNQKERYGVKTAIRQAQTWLQKNGYGWKATKFNWKKYYAGDTWHVTLPTGKKTSVKLLNGHFNNQWINNKIGRNKGDWYMMLRFKPTAASPTIAGPTYASEYEMELQKRLDNYPGGLDGFWMGSVDGKVRYDGRYGNKTSQGVRLLLKLAEESDGSNGYWLTTRGKELLEMGFTVNGKYDFPTKLAVYAFQNNMIKAGKLSGQPTGIIDAKTMKLMTEEEEYEETIPGKVLADPQEAYEPRMTFYEREIWGRPYVEDAEAVRSQESFFYRSRNKGEAGEGKFTDSLFQRGFDIYINYGPFPQYIQSKLNKISGDLSFNTTVKAIRNIQITDVQMVHDARTGEPIEEVYTFIARDLD